MMEMRDHFHKAVLFTPPLALPELNSSRLSLDAENDDPQLLPIS